MLEISALETLPVKIFGIEYKLAKPTRKQMVEMQTVLGTENGKTKSLEVLGDFLVSSGLPVDVVDELQIQHITLLIEAMTGAKKK